MRTGLTCDATFNDDKFSFGFGSERISKIGQHSATFWATVNWHLRVNNSLLRYPQY